MTDLIKKMFLFRDVDFESINKKYSVTEKLQIADFEVGQTVMSSADGKKGVFLVLEGNAYISSLSKRHSAPLRFLGKGDSFGAASLYGKPTEHRTCVIAKSCLKVIILPIELITELIENESRIAFNYIGFLSDRVSFLNRKITAFSAGSTEEKLALYLISLPCQENMLIQSESYTRIAKMLDIGRASLYRALDTLENEKIIHRDGKHIFLDDRERLLMYIK